MINFNFVEIHKVIIHKIIEKTDSTETATVDYSGTILDLNHEVKETVLKRIKDAFKKTSKSFELEIINSHESTFPFICQQLFESHIKKEHGFDSLFISKSQEIADLLAESQDRANMSTGYLLVIFAIHDKLPIMIIIKAEPHDAVSIDNLSSLQKLNVILSPSQKLFKIGILNTKSYSIGTKLAFNFDALLFDDQFSNGSPAEYFCKDFLNFSIDNNAAIQTQKFFEFIEAFISSNFSDTYTKQSLLSALRSVTFKNLDATLHPAEFCESYIKDSQIKEKFYREVVNKMPSQIVKDKRLLKSKESEQSINFTNGVRLKVPMVENSNAAVIIDDPDNPNITIIKVSGKPYVNRSEQRNISRS